MNGLEEGAIVGIKGMQVSHGGAGLRSPQGRLTGGCKTRITENIGSSLN